MTNPARDTRARVMSAAIEAADESDAAYVEVKEKLAGHMRRLNLIDESARAALLNTLLPQYDAYIAAEIAAATGRQNDVLLKLLSLKFLAGDVAGAMTIAEYAISSGMKYDGAESMAEYIAGQVVAQALADGTLQQVLAPSAQVRFAIHAVWPEGPWLPQKTRAAIDALREGLPLTATPG